MCPGISWEMLGLGHLAQLMGGDLHQSCLDILWNSFRAVTLLPSEHFIRDKLVNWVCLMLSEKSNDSHLTFCLAGAVWELSCFPRWWLVFRPWPRGWQTRSVGPEVQVLHFGCDHAHVRRSGGVWWGTKSMCGAQPWRPGPELLEPRMQSERGSGTGQHHPEAWLSPL